MLMMTAANRLIDLRPPTDPQMVAHVHGPAADGLVTAGLASDPAEAPPPHSLRTHLEWLIEHVTGCHLRQVDLKWARKQDELVTSSCPHSSRRYTLH